MVTVISRFRVRNGLEDEVRRAFLNRPRLVENAAGFCGLEVLTDAVDPSIFLLLTRWTDEAAFQAWHRSEAHHQSHQFMPPGLKLDPSFTSITIGNKIEDPAGIQNLGDALEGRTLALSQWLTDFDGLFALLLAPDGTIRARNRAANRIVPPHPENESRSSVWEYLVSDAQKLRERLSNPQLQDHGTLLLNLTNGQQDPVTFEVGLVRCSGAFLLLGTLEHRYESRFQAQTLELTNDLSLMMRELAQKNRELQAANETIDRLAGTDALTGLANRRTLNETLRREIARSQRLSEPLSLIMADLDHFKAINDQYGHNTGDHVLVCTAAVFTTQSRSYDLAARYGGEEFLLILPKTSSEDALKIAERLRKAVAQMEVPGCSRAITISLGVATWLKGEASEPFIGRADAALYRAKNAGRDRVEAASAVPALAQSGSLRP